MHEAGVALGQGDRDPGADQAPRPPGASTRSRRCAGRPRRRPGGRTPGAGRSGSSSTQRHLDLVHRRSSAMARLGCSSAVAGRGTAAEGRRPAHRGGGSRRASTARGRPGRRASSSTAVEIQGRSTRWARASASMPERAPRAGGVQRADGADPRRPITARPTRSSGRRPRSRRRRWPNPSATATRDLSPDRRGPSRRRGSSRSRQPASPRTARRAPTSPAGTLTRSRNRTASPYKPRKRQTPSSETEDGVKTRLSAVAGGLAPQPEQGGPEPPATGVRARCRLDERASGRRPDGGSGTVAGRASNRGRQRRQGPDRCVELSRRSRSSTRRRSRAPRRSGCGAGPGSSRRR